MLAAPLRPATAQRLPTGLPLEPLPGLAVFSQSFCTADVTFIGETDHRDGILQDYYLDPRFTEAARACGIRVIVIEAASIIQPLIEQLAQRRLPLASFVEQASALEIMKYRPTKEVFEKVGQLVHLAANQGIRVIAGDVGQDYPRTPEIVGLIEEFRAYAYEQQLPVGQKLWGQSPPYNDFYPGIIAQFADFVAAYPQQVAHMEEARTMVRTSEAWNKNILLQIAKGRLGYEPENLDLLRATLPKTLIMFGAAHGKPLASWLERLGLVFQPWNFERDQLAYSLHRRGLVSADIGNPAGLTRPGGGWDYPNRQAVIAADGCLMWGGFPVARRDEAPACHLN